MLGAERDKGPDGRCIAALDVAAEELAALGEAEGVDGGGAGEDGVGGDVGADGGELGGEVAEESAAEDVSAGVEVGGGCRVDERFAVGGTVVGETDRVDECSWVYGGGEFGDLFDTVGIIRIPKSVPDEEGKLFWVVRARVV